MNFTHMLKGIGGEPELIRTMGAFGVGAYILGALGFEAWAMARGGAFDVVAFCTAFPAGLGVAIGAAAGAVALKDRGVASAKAAEAQRVAQTQAGGGAA